MLSITYPSDKETLCSLCLTRGFYCDATVYGKCDCCDCMPELCVPVDRGVATNPLPPPYLKEVA
jgi:hypothetical protein